MNTYIVIPAYKERANLERLLPQLPYPAIIVDDNSQDGVELVLRSGDQLIQRPSLQGVGSAVKRGLEEALKDPQCDRVITMDADFSHPPELIPSLLTSSPLTIGSRYIPGGKIEGWSLFRRIESRGANLLAHFFLHLSTRDNTGNFRAYDRRAACIAIQAKGNTNDWLISSLYLLSSRGIEGREIPITYRNRKQGHSKLKLSHLISFLQLLIHPR
jgi:dolichol-phosphate mannosyltransferase